MEEDNAIQSNDRLKQKNILSIIKNNVGIDVKLCSHFCGIKKLEKEHISTLFLMKE